MLGSIGTEAMAYRTAPHWQPPVITGERFASDMRWSLVRAVRIEQETWRLQPYSRALQPPPTDRFRSGRPAAPVSHEHVSFPCASQYSFHRKGHRIGVCQRALAARP